jgi:hypothetical protein
MTQYSEMTEFDKVLRLMRLGLEAQEEKFAKFTHPIDDVIEMIEGDRLLMKGWEIAGEIQHVEDEKKAEAIRSRSSYSAVR